MTQRYFRTLSSVFTAAALLGLSSIADASSFTPGNLVVVRVGDGTSPLTSAATAVFLDEYTPSGTLVQTIALPTTVSGSNFRLVNSGTSTSEAYLNLSTNGQYLFHTGYDAPVGTAAIAGTACATVARVVARIDLNGNIDTTTALTDAYDAGNPRAATSDNGTNIWTSGTGFSAGMGTASAGPRYTTLGSSTSTQVSGSPSNTRVIGIYNGQLYTTSASGSFLGLCSIGTGLPTNGGNMTFLVQGFPANGTHSNYDYFFADPSTVYVADDGAAANGGGLQKWTESGGVWTQQYILVPLTGNGCRSVTGYVSGGSTTLFVTTTQTNANEIETVTDTGAGSAFSLVATGAANTAIRGMRYLGFAATPVNYCTAGTTTNGCNATIGGTGSASVSQTSGFVVSVSNVEGQKQGIIFYGTNGPVATPWGFGGSSFLCVKAPTQRTGTQSSGGTTGQCNGTLSLDLLAYLAANPTALGNPFSAGQQCWLQGWFRDPPAVKTTSLSDGLEVTFTP